MKSIKTKILIVEILLTATVIFGSCKKEAKTVEPVVEYGKLSLVLNTVIDGSLLSNYGDTIINASGRRIAVSMAQLYISNVKLIKDDNTYENAPSVNILQRQGVTNYMIGDVPTGNYKTIRFDVGLSDETNSKNPDASNLTLYQPSMWFGSTVEPDGFIFVNFEGMIDPSVIPDAGATLVPFKYAVGLSFHRMTITMPSKYFEIYKDQETSIHLDADYFKLTEGIQFNLPSDLSMYTVYDNVGYLGDKVSDNVNRMYSYE